MKSKAVIPLVFGLVVGVIAIRYTMEAVKKAQGAPVDTQLIQVVMARQDIPSTSAITPDMLVLMQTPRTPLLPPDTFAKLEDLVGRVALKSVPQGAPILPSMVAPKGTLPGLMVRVKEGYRAVGVKIDESSGVGYLVNPNDWVDVLAVMEVTKGRKKETVSEVVLERVQVGAVGQILNEKPEEGTGSNNHAKTVTLLVKVEDVPKLHMAQTRGRITLAMRGNADMVLREMPTTLANEPAKTSFLATLWKSATTLPEGTTWTAPEEAPTPPEPSLTHTVAVVNSSAANDASLAVQHVTYRDDQSMEVVSTDRGLASQPRFRGGPNQPGGVGYAPAPRTQPISPVIDEEDPDDLESNEVTE